jgi:hypothetical protein
MTRKAVTRAALISCAAACIILGTVASALAAPTTDVGSALQPFENFMRGLVNWLLGPGRLLIALAWLVVGFKVVLGMERAGAGGFVFVALVGLAIVYAPNILSMLGIDISQWVGR